MRGEVYSQTTFIRHARSIDTLYRATALTILHYFDYSKLFETDYLIIKKLSYYNDGNQATK